MILEYEDDAGDDLRGFSPGVWNLVDDVAIARANSGRRGPFTPDGHDLVETNGIRLVLGYPASDTIRIFRVFVDEDAMVYPSKDLLEVPPPPDSA